MHHFLLGWERRLQKRDVRDFEVPLAAAAEQVESPGENITDEDLNIRIGSRDDPAPTRTYAFDERARALGVAADERQAPRPRRCDRHRPPGKRPAAPTAVSTRVNGMDVAAAPAHHQES